MEKSKKSSIWSRDFICCFLICFCSSLGYNMSNTYMASYSYFLGATAGIVGFITGIQNGAAVLFRPFTGKLETKFDGRKMLILAQVCGALSCFGYAFLPSVPMVILFRFFGGFHISLGIFLCLSLVSESLPQEKMGSGLAMYSIGGNVCGAIGPIMAEKIMQWGEAISPSLGYTVSFVVSGLIYAAAIIPSLCLTREISVPRPALKSDEPWYKQIFLPEELLLSLMAVLIFAANRLPGSYLVLYGEELSLAAVSSFFLVQSVALISSKPFTGKLIDKFGPAKVYFPFAIIFAAAFVLIGFAKGIVELLIAAALIGVSFGILGPSIQTLCITNAPPEKRSAACSTSQLGTDLGCCVGPAIFGGMIYPIVGTYSNMYTLASIPALLSAVLLMVFLRKRRAMGAAAVQNNA